MINCLSDWTVYTGPDAKLFEKCSLGSDQTITIWTHEPVLWGSSDLNSNTGGVYKYFLGASGLNTDNTFCLNVFSIGASTASAYDDFVANSIEYIIENYVYVPGLRSNTD